MTGAVEPAVVRAEPVERSGTGPLLPLWAAVPAAIVGGLVYDLGFPGVGFWPLAFAGIAIALVTLIGRTSWAAFFVGFAFGLAFYLQHVSWTSLYLGPVPWLGASRKTVSWVDAVAPVTSATCTSATPMRPGSPSSVLPLTRT